MNSSSVPIFSPFGFAGQADSSKEDPFLTAEMSLADFQKLHISDEYDGFAAPETPIRNPQACDGCSPLSVSSFHNSCDALLESFLVSPLSMPAFSPVSAHATVGVSGSPFAFLAPRTPEEWHLAPTPIISSPDESNGHLFGTVEGFDFDTQSCVQAVQPLLEFNADINSDAYSSSPESVDSQLPSPADSQMPLNPESSEDFSVQIPITPFHSYGSQLFTLEPESQSHDSNLDFPTLAPSPFAYSSESPSPYPVPILQPVNTLLDSSFSFSEPRASSSSLEESRNPARHRRASRRAGNPYAHESRSPASALSTHEEERILESSRLVETVDEAGELVLKHQCSTCGVKIGRAPDLKRHMLTCLFSKKYNCRDIVLCDGSIWEGCKAIFSRRDACFRHLRRRLEKGGCGAPRLPRPSPHLPVSSVLGSYKSRMRQYQVILAEREWRKALPAEEKNRLADEALEDIKQPMFQA